MAVEENVENVLAELAEHVRDSLEDEVIETRIAYDELAVDVVPAQVVKVLKFLQNDPACLFSVLIDICGADYPERTKRFDVVYHLLSPTQNQRIRVKCRTDETTPVPSAVALFPAAGWYEREAFDFYGILFDGHPDLRRLLTDYGFSGHPLRKDFPLTGYVEVRYDDEQKRVIYEPVQLAQEFRSFDFMSPWEGPGSVVLPGDEKAGDAGDNG